MIIELLSKDLNCLENISLYDKLFDSDLQEKYSPILIIIT